MTHVVPSRDELRQAVFELIIREMGPEALARFAQENLRGEGDWSRDRDTLLPDLTVDQWASELERRRGEATEGDEDQRR